MSRINFQSFSGYVTAIEDFMVSPSNDNAGCYKFFSIENEDGALANFIVSPNTYFVDHETVSVGDWITAYYDGDAPAILIYPPQYPALIIVKENPYRQVKVDFFNQDLISSDGMLQLNISSITPILLTNGQILSNNLADRNLIVSYGPTTKSIPAQTTPYEIIVFCRSS